MVQKMDKELKSSERTLRNVQKLNSELKTEKENTKKEIKQIFEQMPFP
jgi:septal ring factor EnvC (AmiA/AmiB activator)